MTTNALGMQKKGTSMNMQTIIIVSTYMHTDQWSITIQFYAGVKGVSERSELIPCIYY